MQPNNNDNATLESLGWQPIDNATLVSGIGDAEKGSGWCKGSDLIAYHDSGFDIAGYYLYSKCDAESGKRTNDGSWHCYDGPYATIGDTLSALKKWSNPFNGIASR